MKNKKVWLAILVIVIVIAVIVMVVLLNNNKKASIVIFSSMEDYRNQALKEQLKSKFPDIDVKVQYLSTGNNAAKIKAEGKSTEADIIVDLETAHAENLKDNFADLSEYDTSNYIEGINPNHNKYLTWVKYASAFIINKEVIEEKGLAIPTKYEDLLDPSYKGLIAMPDPKTSGTGYMFYKDLVNIMGEEKALEYFDKLQENVKQFTASGSGPVNLLSQKEIAVGLGMIAQAVESINKNVPLEIIMPETGCPYNTTSIAIIDGKQNNENVKEVFKWLISDFSKYEKESFMPEKIFKEQESNIKNYPTNIKYADMTGISDAQEKENLIKKWKY